MRELNVAIPGKCHHLPVRLDLQQPLQYADKIGDRNGGGVAEVVDPNLCRPRLLAAAPRALLRCVESRHASPDDVVDVSEIPGDRAAVRCLEDRDRLALEDVPREEEVGHVGPTPGAVDGEEPEPREGEPVDVVVRVGDLLASLLGGRVQAGRLVGPVLL